MTGPTMLTLAKLEAALTLSEAQLAVGDLISVDQILAEEQAVLARLKPMNSPIGGAECCAAFDPVHASSPRSIFRFTAAL
jgi:hypothetical protein